MNRGVGCDLRLLVGLGNPGTRYELTRHNAGERWVRDLAARFQIELRSDSRFKGDVGRGTILNTEVRILVPTTFMNLSGESVRPFVSYFDIASEQVLIAYDEVAFDVGTVRLKIGGGHNGHNGLKNVLQHVSDPNFARLRIGVGHPGVSDEMVSYLTGAKMPSDERELCTQSCTFDDELLGLILSREWQRAMTKLHSKPDMESSDSPCDAADPSQ